MNKREIIEKIATEKEDKILFSHLLDIDLRAYEKGIPLPGCFLDLNRASQAESCNKYFSCNLIFFGGYEDAERKVIYFVPDGAEADFSDITVLCSKTSGALSHRDVLGALMGLGIDRSQTGDILIEDNCLKIILKKEIASFVIQNFLKSGRQKLSFTEMSYIDLVPPEKKVKEITGTIKTLRLDSVISLAFGISRANAKDFINGAKVFVNDKSILKSDFAVKEGDKLTLRGKGKAYLTEIGDLSRKERIFIKIQRYL